VIGIGWGQVEKEVCKSKRVRIYGRSYLVRADKTLLSRGELDVSFHPVKANWKRRAEIIDYCVKVVDDEARQAGQNRSDHRAEVGDDDRVTRRPSSSSSLSVGVANETKVQ
jgi:hypothetical protein